MSFFTVLKESEPLSAFNSPSPSPYEDESAFDSADDDFMRTFGDDMIEDRSSIEDRPVLKRSLSSSSHTSQTWGDGSLNLMNTNSLPLMIARHSNTSSTMSESSADQNNAACPSALQLLEGTRFYNYGSSASASPISQPGKRDRLGDSFEDVDLLLSKATYRPSEYETKQRSAVRCASFAEKANFSRDERSILRATIEQQKEEIASLIRSSEKMAAEREQSEELLQEHVEKLRTEKERSQTEKETLWKQIQLVDDENVQLSKQITKLELKARIPTIDIRLSKTTNPWKKKLEQDKLAKDRADRKAAQENLLKAKAKSGKQKEKNLNAWIDSRIGDSRIGDSRISKGTSKPDSRRPRFPRNGKKVAQKKQLVQKKSTPPKNTRSSRSRS